MAGQISMATRAEVAEALQARYAASGRSAKGVILDEFVALTGLHRKHAIRLLRAQAGKRRPRGRPRTRYRSGREGGAGPALGGVGPGLLEAAEADDPSPAAGAGAARPAAPDEDLRAALLAISPATIDRLLAETRIAAAQGRRRRAGQSSAVRRSVPVRTFAGTRQSHRQNEPWFPASSTAKASRASTT